jgi:aspartyl-tRNA(Asn)/glutamyl-tRNA(Gln) amidotransferase subunit A
MGWQGLAGSKGSREKWKAFAETRDKALGAFLRLDTSLSDPDAAREGPLAGIPFAVKDNIAVRGLPLTCGSRILEDFTSPYTATAVARLQAAGGVVAGKTNLDEFGMGSSTENSAFQVTRNPWDPERVPGGSSGGTAAAVAAGIVPFGLGSDTGGSVRQPAAFCGVYGLKPTWGAVSRFGLVAYASSLEVIGIVAKTVDMTADVFRLLRGKDPLDHSSIDWEPAARRPGRLRIGVPRECSDVPMHDDVKSAAARVRALLTDLGHEVREISLPTLAHVVSAYYVIATAEASANLARYDGVRYGRRAPGADTPDAMTFASRTGGFGAEVKLRILLGTYVLRSGFQDEYYLRAQKIRTAIRNDFQAAFSGVDLVLMPAYPVPPFLRGSADADPFTQKLADVFTCAANLAGLPAMSFPAGVEHGLPIGMQLLAPPLAEELLLDACRQLEARLPSPDAPGYAAAGGA